MYKYNNLVLAFFIQRSKETIDLLNGILLWISNCIIFILITLLIKLYQVTIKLNIYLHIYSGNYQNLSELKHDE
jgi:hypothetical protein